VTFRSRYRDVRGAIHRLDREIRRFGLEPRPLRGGDLRDRLEWTGRRAGWPACSAVSLGRDQGRARGA
jgi:hypothetical protein